MMAVPENAVRYECLIDPSDCYLIWDRATGLPCTAVGHILVFTRQEEAVEAIRLLENGMPAMDLFRKVVGDFVR